MNLFKRVAVPAVGAALLVSAAACSGSSSSGSGASSSGSGPGTTVTVLYSNNYVFNSDSLATKWWNGIAQQWKAKYPHTKLVLEGTGGTDTDLMNKAAILFRSPSTTPDVIQLPTTYVAQFAGSDYLEPLNNFVGSSQASSFWPTMPAGVQNMSAIDGTVYAVNAGNNNTGLLYNKAMLEKAGVKMPWNPTNWQQILQVAQKVKAANPGVWPLWVASGVAAGPTNVLQGSGNLIFGSSNTTMYDTKTKKWVVNSSGIRATLQFYQEMDKQGLGAPTSQLFRDDAVGQPPLLMKQGKLAISIGSNWYPTVWASPQSAAPWAAAKTEVGSAPFPTENGQGPGAASTLGGWAYAVAKASKNVQGAEDFIALASSPANQLTTAVWSGFVPPSTPVGTQPSFVNFAPPFQADFNNYAKYGVALPNNVNFPVYARALNTVTGDFAQNPNASMSTELAKLSSLVSQQLGPNSVETQP
jgi:multiple sugar transport system substrate-binding protein